ncbi:hypothetical protein [Salinicola rhizosphaerae]|uniref:Uncharacterized protein n=1 Tax=Salinicola rhizosphaerae TaxID=1443141 RepID=A0ABQ3EFJ8_9GAMM|nr:hypothetical protein [Salinicola rhizosphaerae]GHB33127.1 hypothetical protein GCM10009038_35150 [Salinicola rhizosphaerae]
MPHTISCTRCGHAQIAPIDSADDWDEINCSECGDFLDTVGHCRERLLPAYHLQTLNQSRALILQLARENQALNDHPLSQRISA